MAVSARVARVPPVAAVAVALIVLQLVVRAVGYRGVSIPGLAFDERGEAFLTNCVIEHAFHVG